MAVKDEVMPPAEKPATITADPEFQAAINRVLEGKRDQSMRSAAERMDKMREDIRGTGNIDLASLSSRNA